MNRSLEEVVDRLPPDERERARGFLSGMPEDDLASFDALPMDDRLWVLGAWRAREEIEADGGLLVPLSCPRCGEFEARLAAGSCDMSYGWWRKLFGFHPKTTTTCPKCGSKAVVKLAWDELSRREPPDLW